jgi:pyrimidine operon attenuation protein/uracil phosphoribosyltransferase
MRLLRRSVKPRPPPRRYSRPRSLERLIYSPPARRYIPVIEGVRTHIVSVPPGGGDQWGPCGWRRCSQRVLPGQDGGPLIGSASTPTDPLSPSREAGKERPVAQDRPGAAAARELLSASDVARTVARIAHQIIEKTAGTENVVLVGIPTRGAMLARRLGAAVAEFSGTPFPVGIVDPTLYREPAPPPGAGRCRAPPPRRGLDDALVCAHRHVLMSRPLRAAALDALARPTADPAVAAGRALDRGTGSCRPGRLRGKERAHRPRRAGQGLLEEIVRGRAVRLERA